VRGGKGDDGGGEGTTATATTISPLFKLALAPLCVAPAPTVSPWAVLAGDFEGAVSVFDVRRCDAGNSGGGGSAHRKSTTPLLQVVKGGFGRRGGKLKVKFHSSSGVGVVGKGRDETRIMPNSPPPSFLPFFVGKVQEEGGGCLPIPAIPYHSGDVKDFVVLPPEADLRSRVAGEPRPFLHPSILVLSVSRKHFFPRLGWTILSPPLCGIEGSFEEGGEGIKEEEEEEEEEEG